MSRVNMADPAANPQLISGLYDVENKAWRWTAKRFVVTFPTPAEVNGATLTLHLFISENQIKSLGPMTLDADVNGSILQSETFSAPGVYTYSQPVPPTVLKSNIIPVVFYLNKAVPPTGPETRELGVVVNDVELKSY